MATRAILAIRLLCRSRVDPGALMDRLDAVHDNAVAYIDARFDDDICPDGLSKLYFFLEGMQLWRFHGIGAVRLPVFGIG